MVTTPLRTAAPVDPARPCRSAYVRQRVCRRSGAVFVLPSGLDSVARQEPARSIATDFSSSGRTAPTFARPAPWAAVRRVRCWACRRSQRCVQWYWTVPTPEHWRSSTAALLGGDVTYADDDWVNLRDGGNVLLSFQRAPDYQPPDWPSVEHGQQFHIDVTVDDVDQAEPQVLALGARRTDLQPGIDEDSNWRVYLDPVGHPFCLCWD